VVGASRSGALLPVHIRTVPAGLNAATFDGMPMRHPPEDEPDPVPHPLAPAGEPAVIGAASPRNPVAVAGVFWQLLDEPDARARTRRLRQLVTPASLAHWGDFTQVRDHLAGTGMSSVADYPAPHVAYVEFRTPLMCRAVATLHWHEDRGVWLVHAVGPPIAPGDGTSAGGFAAPA
jgi:hypothetical protein